MTQEDEQLLLQDLSAKLPYGVKAEHPYAKEALVLGIIERKGYKCGIRYIDVITDKQTYPIRYIKPYLRPMSSMTEEEKGELLNHVLGGEGVEYFHIAYDGSIDGNQEAEQDLYNLNLHWLNFGPLTTASYIDWLNKKMFDFRGLIPKGLAIAVTRDNNPYKY